MREHLKQRPIVASGESCKGCFQWSKTNGSMAALQGVRAQWRFSVVVCDKRTSENLQLQEL